MAHYSDSSGSYEDLDDAIDEILAKEDPFGSTWLEESERDEAPARKPKDPMSIAARAYQVEMLEASLKENVIVAMDTGSGKTQVSVSPGGVAFVLLVLIYRRLSAVLRIRAELERMSSGRYQLGKEWARLPPQLAA